MVECCAVRAGPANARLSACRHSEQLETDSVRLRIGRVMREQLLGQLVHRVTQLVCACHALLLCVCSDEGQGRGAAFSRRIREDTSASRRSLCVAWLSSFTAGV